VAKPSVMATRDGWIEVNMVQISPFVEQLLGEDLSPLQCALCISKSRSFSNYCTIFRRNRRLSPKI